MPIPLAVHQSINGNVISHKHVFIMSHEDNNELRATFLRGLGVQDLQSFVIQPDDSNVFVPIWSKEGCVELVGLNDVTLPLCNKRPRLAKPYLDTFPPPGKNDSLFYDDGAPNLYWLKTAEICEEMNNGTYKTPNRKKVNTINKTQSTSTNKCYTVELVVEHPHPDNDNDVTWEIQLNLARLLYPKALEESNRELEMEAERPASRTDH